MMKGLWIPPGFYSGGSSGTPTEIVMLTSSSSNTTNITAPSDIEAGDLLVLFQYSDNPPSYRVPTGFVIPANCSISGNLASPNDDINVKIVLSYKVADGSEGGTSLQGMTVNTGLGGKLLAVFRPDKPITNAASFGSAGQYTNGNPSAQLVSSGNGTPPLIVIGAYGSYGVDQPDINTRTFNPAKDSEISRTFGIFVFGGQIWLAWKIYNANDTPVNHTIDMNDEDEGNALMSCYIQVS